MNTFWLKIAGVVVLVIVAAVGIMVFTSSGESEPEPEQKTIYDMAERDRRKFLSRPKQAEAEPSPAEQAGTEPNRPAEPSKSDRAAPGRTRPAPKPAGPVTMYFSELSETDKIEAERFLNIAVPGRSIGRLPVTGFKLMVDNCRRIIEKWPESWYAYKAKQMLADMPPRYHMRYKVTEQELDISRFTRPREGTKPFVVEQVD